MKILHWTSILPVLVLFAAAIPALARFDMSACENTVPQSEISPECLALMEAFPTPTVLAIPKDTRSLSNYSFWRVTNPTPNIYDAPNGNVVRQMGAGFNFVSVLQVTDGWVQIESGEWMRDADVQYREASPFSGVRILDGLENRFAWVLGTLVTSPFPGAQQNMDTGRVIYRYELVNIFAEAYDDEGWRWYMVGPNEWVEQRVVSKVSRIERPEGVQGRWVAIDLYEQTLVAYENDTPVFATVIATGLPGTDTEEGLFTVWAKLERDRMSGFAGAPTAYNLESVPWVMYFDGSVSLHGTYWHGDFGYRRSRGCVNLSISDAKYLFDWFSETPPDENGDVVNYVYVYSSGEYRSSGAATK